MGSGAIVGATEPKERYAPMRRMPSAEHSGSCFGFDRAAKASAAVITQGRPSGRRGCTRSTGAPVIKDQSAQKRRSSVF